MRSINRSINLEWGYASRKTSFIRRILTVLIATAVGASIGGIAVLSFFALSIGNQQGQSSLAVVAPTPPSNRNPVDLESANAAEVTGHSAGATAIAPSRPIFAEHRTATDRNPGDAAPVAAETSGPAVSLVETNLAKRPRIAISETPRSIRRYAFRKYYMRVGDARPHHAHRAWFRAYQNADWPYGSWN